MPTGTNAGDYHDEHGHEEGATNSRTSSDSNGVAASPAYSDLVESASMAATAKAACLRRVRRSAERAPLLVPTDPVATFAGAPIEVLVLQASVALRVLPMLEVNTTRRAHRLIDPAAALTTCLEGCLAASCVVLDFAPFRFPVRPVAALVRAPTFRIVHRARVAFGVFPACRMVPASRELLLLLGRSAVAPISAFASCVLDLAPTAEGVAVRVATTALALRLASLGLPRHLAHASIPRVTNLGYRWWRWSR
mmetsp:Transcript_108827/g.314245  ORF Transcript_108827/g.314245 Transcript_108827/m.314245 type:complete len:251 (+) Transcript_108827:160-912(+)